jgi:hypothetical protein
MATCNCCGAAPGNDPVHNCMCGKTKEETDKLWVPILAAAKNHKIDQEIIRHDNCKYRTYQSCGSRPASMAERIRVKKIILGT